MQKVIAIIIFLSLLFLVNPNLSKAQEYSSEINNPIATSYEKAKVLEIQDVKKQDPITGDNIIVQKVKLEILSGEHKGEKQNIENNLFGNPLDLKVKEGDKVIIYIEEFAEGSYLVQIQDHYRLPSLVILIIVFLLFLGIIGKGSGLRTIASLIISLFLIFKVFIPASLKGINPVLLVLVISVLITVVTLLMIAGFRKKTYAAILGTVAGLVVATIMVLIFGKLAHLSGLAGDDARILFNKFPDLSFRGLLFAGIILGALGAVMDVSISIASSISEIKKNHPEISFKNLASSGLTVGRDIMGTMANTLIFAYVGASIFILLLFNQYGESYLKFLNFSFIAEEVVRSMAGSLGLIAAIPLTALFAAYLENKKPSQANRRRDKIH